jgi:Gluconate 2-dehydrogenase subunit 3
MNPNSPLKDPTISRRDIFRLLAAGGATTAMLSGPAAAAETAVAALPKAKRALTDPDFNDFASPWEKPMVNSELATLAVLVDLLLPADELSPAPSAIGVPDFLNDWIGAPYPENIRDAEIIRGGVAWINTHATQLHQQRFAKLTVAQQTAILDSICDPVKSAPQLAAGTRFFTRLRTLALSGYYTHSSTWKSLGYVGNMPIGGAYPGVPDEVLKALGLTSNI